MLDRVYGDERAVSVVVANPKKVAVVSSGLSREQKLVAIAILDSGIEPSRKQQVFFYFQHREIQH